MTEDAPDPASPAGKPAAELSEAELLVSDAVGRLIEFWGFKRNMGRIWSILYLAAAPLTAAELKDLLQISSGAVSMTLTELMRWGVIKRVWVPGERRDYYEAEVALWRMISRVLGERERIEIAASIDAFERGLVSLQNRRARLSGQARAHCDEQAKRIRALLDLARLGRTLLDALLSTAKLDAEPLARFFLRARDD